jgi:Trypsin-like peptidase domain
MSPSKADCENAKRAVVQLGDARGFVVSSAEYRYVITAAHCLPCHPQPHLANGVNELTYQNIVGPLARKKRTIWAELCADNLVDDVAVFSAPDDQELSDQCESYEAFTTAAAAMLIGIPPAAVEPYNWRTTPATAAWVLSLDGKWQRCLVQYSGRFLSIKEDRKIKGGMSGSPIIDANGAAIGLISTGGSGMEYASRHPSLMDCLPPWLLRKLDAVTVVPAKSPAAATSSASSSPAITS